MRDGKIVLLIVGAAALVARAEGLREDEVTCVADVQRVEVDQAIDLRDRWPVEALGEIALPYSAAAGTTVRLNLMDGALVGREFSPGTVNRDLATGLTGEGTYAWMPSGIEKKVYRILHQTTSGGQIVEDETYRAYFDFTECEMISAAEFRSAVMGISQPVSCSDDPHHPWSLIGTAGEGLRNPANGSKLTFTFTDAGAFGAELLVAEGTVTVAIDGEMVATVPPNAEWTAYAWPVVGQGVAHTVTLTYSGTAEVGVRGCALMGEVEDDIVLRETEEMAVDLRAVFPVVRLESEPALQGFAYSAIGWDLVSTADATRTVAITARAGALVDGVFTSDGSAETTVLAETTGAGTTDWHPSSVAKKVYQLTHTVKKSGAVDGPATLYGYLDFSKAESLASQAEVETAVLGEITHPIVVRQDEQSPWQPIDSTQARSGIATDESLATENETATTFAFKGRGVLHFDYELTGGTLAAVSGDETVLTFDEPTAGWVSGQVTFTGYGAHEVAFVYTADGGMAAIRNVRWEEQTESCRANGEGGPVVVDLQEGVRTPKYLADILPFEYSSTNWIGDVAQVSAESIARVTIERLTGTDPDVRNWTESAPGTFRELVKESGEVAVKWRPRKGVWLATFDILNADASIHRETALFDLRNARSFGFVLIVK